MDFVKPKSYSSVTRFEIKIGISKRLPRAIAEIDFTHSIYFNS